METLPERLADVEKVYDLTVKGWNLTQIANELSISRAHAKSLLADAKALVNERLEEDPEFLDRIQESTIRFLDEFDKLTKEAWEALEYAKGQEIVGVTLNAIKVIDGLATKKAQLHQLLGTNVDTTNIAKMRKLERVNEIVSGIIREIVSQCPHCRDEARMRLAEAFRLMERSDEIVDLEPEPQLELPTLDDDILDADLVDAPEALARTISYE